ncbi:MAG: 2OG-Fe(II) oxygenase [Alphaproteobacteria bacterium]|nr:2OG-Fe(II) oxygenase [Alphaproteobacteria bacterium]
MSSLNRAAHIKEPYDYWLLDDALPATTCDAVADLPFAPPSGATFDGRRESNNSTRVYFTPENQSQFVVCRDVAQAFGNAGIIAALERTTGTDLSCGALRIEYCQDIDGFWLEPHLDISVKLFTMLIYLSDDPNLADAGTDVYDATPAHNLVATSPYGKGKGLIFIPGHNTWHGFTKRRIEGLRKSIIVNFVSPEWQNQQELAYA